MKSERMKLESSDRSWKVSIELDRIIEVGKIISYDLGCSLEGRSWVKVNL